MSETLLTEHVLVMYLSMLIPIPPVRALGRNLKFKMCQRVGNEKFLLVVCNKTEAPCQILSHRCGDLT